MMDGNRTRWIGVGIAGGAALAAYHLVLQPWHMRLGSTDAEVTLAMPGEEAVPEPQAVTTHHAPKSHLTVREALLH